MRYIEIAEINRRAAHPRDFVDEWERAYHDELSAAADHIVAECDKKPIILLSGPSGSGKTTTAHRLEQLLRERGHNSHTLSMDNYYFRREDGYMPIDEEGNVDLESPEIVDITLLANHLVGMARCEPIEMPAFDFANQRRKSKTTTVARARGELIIVEGIHALNPDVTGDTHEFSTGIYISVRTRVRDSAGYVLHPSKIRLMRRLIRDKAGRGQSFDETIERMRSVDRGERLYIMPHKDRADIAIDTFCPYEMCVYRDMLLAGLQGIDNVFLEDCHVSDVAPMLRQMGEIDSALVPAHSMVREFIGGQQL